MQCRKEDNIKNCPCTHISCPRRGICCLCIKHHRENDELPACYFSTTQEKTYDRSIDNFIKHRK